VPKRSGTKRLLVARCGTNGQLSGYTNCRTSPLSTSDNAEADGSIQTSLTKRPGKELFLEPIASAYRITPQQTPLVGMLAQAALGYGVGRVAVCHVLPAASETGPPERRGWFQKSRQHKVSVAFAKGAKLRIHVRKDKATIYGVVHPDRPVLFREVITPVVMETRGGSLGPLPCSRVQH
jgi:hypothetical protein